MFIISSAASSVFLHLKKDSETLLIHGRGGSRKYFLGWQRGGMGSMRGGNTKASLHAYFWGELLYDMHSYVHKYCITIK